MPEPHLNSVPTHSAAHAAMATDLLKFAQLSDQRTYSTPAAMAGTYVSDHALIKGTSLPDAYLMRNDGMDGLGQAAWPMAAKNGVQPAVVVHLPSNTPGWRRCSRLR